MIRHSQQSNRLLAYQGAVALITGGASGLGRALGEALAQQGAHVVLADLQVDLAEEVAANLRAEHQHATAIAVDVREFASVNQVVQQTYESMGRLDYVFNNAGIVVIGESHLYQLEDWEQVLDVNIRGVVNGVQSAYPILREQGFGHIVNTASIVGLMPLPGTVSYSASKHAVVGLTTALRPEAASFGVKVSALCPGPLSTPILNGGRFGKFLHEVPQELRDNLVKKSYPIPAERFARKALKAIARNKAIIMIPWWWKLLWWIYRLSPSLGLAIARKAHLHFREVMDQATEVASMDENPCSK